MKAKAFLGEELKKEDLGNGLTRCVKAYTDQLMVVEVHFDKGAVGSVHTHPHAQCTYILSGSFLVNLNGEERLLKAGDSASYEPDVPHGLTCLEEGSLLDIFAPKRDDFLK